MFRAATMATDASDNGMPLGADPQTSVFNIDGVGSPVQASFRYNSTYNVDLTWHVTQDCYIVGAQASVIPSGTLREIQLVWAEAPTSIPRR